MKHIILSLATAFILVNSVFGQVPQKMSYQAIIRNSSNALVINTSVGMRISILQSTATGTSVYVETQKPITNTNGLVSVEIGSGTIVSGVFSNIDWSKGPYFIKTETDITGGINYSIVGTSQLLSVPYAMYAGSANSIVQGGLGSGFRHYVGEKFGGGVVFHVFKDSTGVEHGLIVSLNELPATEPYSNLDVAIGITAQSTWDGLSNSNAIVGQIGHTNSAAKSCLDLKTNGLDDWYLPAIDELNLLYNNRFNINRTISRISNADQLKVEIYISSTEFFILGNRALILNFDYMPGNSDYCLVLK